jgi:hypothetical protein
MMSFIRPLLRKPAWTVPAGAVFAAAWLIRAARIGGCGWPGRGRDGRPGVGFGGWSGNTWGRWSAPAPMSGRSSSACGAGPGL